MRHNKKRNTGLLYEFLVRHISKCLIEAKNSEATRAVALLKKYYKTGPLHDEYQLFKSVLHSNIKSPEYASKAIAEVLSQAKAIDTSRLNHAKNRLVKEINKTFDSNAFYNHKIPNYIMYASLQSLLHNANGSKKLNDTIDKIKLEERLVQLVTAPRNTATQALKLDPQYNNAVYRAIINKFNRKYANALTESQKKLLTKYAVALMSENKTVFSNALRNEIDKATQTLTFIADPEIAKDKDLLSKIDECRKRLTTIDTDNIASDHVVSVLQLMSLADEVKR